MGYRSGLEIKKSIIDYLATRPHVLCQLERRLATNNGVVRRHLSELEYLGLVELRTFPRHPKTGRPYTTAELTPLVCNANFTRDDDLQIGDGGSESLFPDHEERGLM